MRDYLIGCDVLGDDQASVQIVSGANVEAPIFLSDDLMQKIETEVVGKGGGGKGGGGGGKGGGGGGKGWGGGGGWRGGRNWGGGPGWGWGGYEPWYTEYYDVEPLACIRYDANGNCLEYVPVIEVVGAYDFNVEQRKMNELKTVPVSVAQALLRGGQAAINGAIAGAKQPWYKPDLPGQTSRSTVAGKIAWHANALRGLTNPNALYASGEDLKHWTLMAFREANAVEAGAAYINTAWESMWSEIATAIKALPAEVRKAVGDIVKLTTGLPIWAWAAIAGGLLVLIGGFIYALAKTKTGAVVANKLL